MKKVGKGGKGVTKRFKALHIIAYKVRADVRTTTLQFSSTLKVRTYPPTHTSKGEILRAP